MQVSDNFNRADGDPGSGYEQSATLINGSAATPAWVIASNVLSPGTTYRLTTIRRSEAFSNDHFCEVKMTQGKWTADRSLGGPAVRCVDNQTMYYLQLNETALTLRSRLAGIEQWHTEYAATFLINTPYTLRLTVAGSLLTVTIDGVQRIQITDSRIPSGGRPGIHMRSGNAPMPTFDDLVAGDLSESGGSSTTAISRRRRV